MSSEPTSSVTAVTTSSLVTTAVPVTTTVNNPPATNPPAENPSAVNENVIKKNQFSYDDKSKLLTVMMIILPILAIVLGLLLELKFEENNYIRFGLILILISNVTVTTLLALHYNKLRDSVEDIAEWRCIRFDRYENEPSCIYYSARRYVIVFGYIGSLFIFLFLLRDFGVFEKINSWYKRNYSDDSL